jgi:general secretion pathway protein F
MPAFEYEALDASGRKTRGLISADSEVAARRELRRRQMAPLKIDRTTEPAKGESGEVSRPVEFSLRRKRLDSRELMLATRQLSSLVDAGMPVEEALGMVGQQAHKHHMRRVLMSVRAGVAEGARLSEAMAAQSGSFPPVYRAMVSAGESAGGLGQVLGRLADYLEQSEALKGRVQGALVYPAVLAATALGVVGVLMAFIVPRIAEQITSMGVALPWLTQAMIAISGFFASWWGAVLVGFAALLSSYFLAMRSVDLHRRRDRLVSIFPGLGGFVRKSESARFARTMGILVNAGAVLPDALRAARRASANLVVQDALTSVIRDVETGRSLSDALRAAKIFPPLMIYMVAAGERSGALGEMFERSADQLEREIDGAVNVGLALLEPGLIIFMAVMVVTIILSILLPILQLNTLALR